MSKLMFHRIIVISLMGITLAGIFTCAYAQWPNDPDPRIPRTKDGKPNLTAPAPRLNGKPDISGDIGLAVQAGCRSSQVRLAVFRTRDARVGIVRPLRISTREDSGKSDSHERDDNCSMKHQFTYSPSPSHRERPRASHRLQSLAVHIRPAP